MLDNVAKEHGFADFRYLQKKIFSYINFVAYVT